MSNQNLTELPINKLEETSEGSSVDSPTDFNQSCENQVQSAKYKISKGNNSNNPEPQNNGKLIK